MKRLAMRRAARPGALAVALAAMLAAGAPAWAGEAVRVGVIGLIADAGIYIAAEKGYFREAGVEMTLEPFATSVKMLPVLSNGQLDVATGGIAASLFNGVAQGLPILVVADKGSTFPGFGTFTKKKRAERRGVEPRTKSPIVIPAAVTITFQPGQDLKSVLNSK